MSEDWHFRIGDILDCIAHLEHLLEKHARNGDDLDIYRAAERNLEIIAVASKHIPQNLKDGYPQIPWQQVTNMRNLIAHEYGVVDQETVWRVARERIPELKIVMFEMLEQQPLPGDAS